jgi:transmembrane sensor
MNNDQENQDEEKKLKAYLERLFISRNKIGQNSMENLERLEDNAAELNNSFSYHKYELPKADKEEIWNNLETLIKEEERVQKKSRSFVILKIAVTLLLLLAFSAIFYFNLSSRFTTVATNYGETKTVVLPDGSTIVLNANSTLRYRNDNPREVWIHGEGFFKIKHTKNDDKFLVRTIDSHSVQVLGTTFNVYNRKSKVEVVLNTGKIKLQVEGKEGVIMKPGELAELKTSSSEYDIRGVDPSIYSSWTNKKLIFRNTRISEIARIIEDTYGLEVLVVDEKLKNQKVSGTIVNESLDGLLYAISETVEMKVTKENKRIILKSRI